MDPEPGSTMLQFGRMLIFFAFGSDSVHVTIDPELRQKHDPGADPGEDPGLDPAKDPRNLPSSEPRLRSMLESKLESMPRSKQNQGQQDPAGASRIQALIQLGSEMARLRNHTQALESSKIHRFRGTAFGTTFEAKPADDGALHSVRSLRLLLCTPHAKRSSGKSTCGRRAYLRILVCSPAWNDHCDLSRHNQVWLPNYSESKKTNQRNPFFPTKFVELACGKIRIWRGQFWVLHFSELLLTPE